MIRRTVLLTSVLSLALVTHVGFAAERLPNFVIIFIDDMGYADIGPFGAEGYSTPNLDRMAKEGRVFTDFYVAQAVCSASRAALMTGCYNVRVGILGALSHTANHGIHADEMTLGDVVKQQGYATACFGKWHLGHHPKFLPTNNGFDEYLGLPYSNDMWPFHPEAGDRFPDLPLMEGTRVIDAQVTHEDQEQLTTRYTERAVQFIEKNKDRPFLVYLPHSMVHVPLLRLRQVSRQVAARPVRRRGDGSRLVGGPNPRYARQAPAEREHARDLHHGQRSVAQLRRSCRIGRPAA